MQQKKSLETWDGNQARRLSESLTQFESVQKKLSVVNAIQVSLTLSSRYTEVREIIYSFLKPRASYRKNS